MMSISPVNNIAYYADLAKEDYYSGHGEPKGIWYGLGSKIFGLQNKTIGDNDYNMLMTGFSPSGEALVQNAGKDNRRAAWDCTLSAPKSVSLAWASSSHKLRQNIEKAIDVSVQKTIQFMEQQVALTRRGNMSSQYEPTAGLIFACFNHCTNRNEEPQLHTHLLALNAAPRMDDTWGSIASESLYHWKMACGAVYRAELAYQMRELGFGIEHDGDSFHLKGVPKKACDAFSSRAQEINYELKKAGILSSSSKQGASFKTRTRKAKKNVVRGQLLERWKGELGKYGLSESYIERLTHGEKELPPSPLDLDFILSGITNNKAVFTEQELYRAIAVVASHNGCNAAQAENLTRLATRSEDLVALKPKNAFSRQFTTLDVLTCEQLMVNDAKTLAKRVSHKVELTGVSEAIHLAENQLGFYFDEEQKEAIQYTLCSGDLSITQGSAGAGKTTLLLAAKIAYEEKSLIIRGACIAKKAADNLTHETGIQSQTIASLISSINGNKHPLRGADILVVDEAGLIPSTDLQQLLHEAKVSTCKVILTGEDKQLDAINRGGALRFLSRPEVLGTQRIETIRRQRQEWAKQVVVYLRDKRSQEALEVLNDHNCVHWAETNEDAIQQLVSDWEQYQMTHPDKQSLVIAREWKDVKELSKAIRDIYIREGKVGTENIKLTCSVADKQFKYEYSVGDRVKFCRNEYRRFQVSNGTLGTIKEIEQLSGNDIRLSIELDDKRIVSFRASEYNDHIGLNLCHAYALTVFSSQGTTVDGNTFTLYSGRMGQRETYVALSRHKDESHMYVNRAEINEHAKSSDEHLVLTDELRQATLEKLLKQELFASLAVEHLLESESSIERENTVPSVRGWCST
ncbi:TPA: relaxase domain-containing protein [Vibrio parahaemolyticus]|uniref:MobF family relaxase n=2 Tax=Vibrio parahaemolyticus TaxID=670 RepID=UPI0011217F6C|nr:MobF family relaxase [Vibrio parahaemolyticus]TOH08222.1 exonuclease V subunit alpha [Vibrio parahaemolyticus]TOP59543.1 exonuclease V subunit alpha [Vibrio parahaemolyticus]HCG8652432.1 relaxase domain-containing protein [Vibrio parahaemolyticus]